MKTFLFVFLLCCVSLLNAQISTEDFSYQYNGKNYRGKICRNPDKTEPMPVVLLVHEWWGLNDYAENRARMVAELGYVVLAVDMYGDGVTAKTMQEAGKFAGELKANVSEMRGRINAALAAVRKLDYVVKNKAAVMGYCFGGTVSLECARSGADVLGVISFHGGLSTPKPEETKNVKARVVVLHGAADKFVPDTEVKAFEKEMNDAGVTWELTSYSGAVHGFTNAANGNNPANGVAYNSSADIRSWEALKSFLNEIFQ